jgi:hypothetical protein
VHQILTAERLTVTVLVDRELRERLERAAAENERSLVAGVRHLLRCHLTDDTKEEHDGKKEG